MITLYHCMSARSFRPLWTLEELGLSYELKMLPFPPRVRQKSYLEINPLGTVPAFFDDGMRMTESSAICHYLAVRHGAGTLAVGPEEADFGPFLNWVHFGEATLTFPQTLILRYGRFEPHERKLPQVVDDYTRWFLSRLRAIDCGAGGSGISLRGTLHRGRHFRRLCPDAGGSYRAGRPFLRRGRSVLATAVGAAGLRQRAGASAGGRP